MSAPRDAEEARIGAVAVAPKKARDREELRLNLNATLVTPTTRARDAEEQRHAAGLR